LAKRDFDEYYNKISSQLFELDKVFKDMEHEVDTGMVEPERIEQLKLTIEPIRVSYHTLSYIKYLLDKPARRGKQGRYDGSKKKVLASSKGYHSSDYINRNDAILKGLRNK
jgi:hypothetical protein